MTFREGDRVRERSTGRVGRVERIVKQWGEVWYEVRLDATTILRGPADDFEKQETGR